MIKSQKQKVKSKKLQAVTLIELLIAMSLVTLIIFAGSAIYLSGWNMFRDAQSRAQAARNAIIPMMHVKKQLLKYLDISPQGKGEIPANLFMFPFLTYTNPPNFSNPTREEHLYVYDSDTGLLTFDYNLLASHLTAFNITWSDTHGTILLNVSLTATDNSGQYSHQLQSTIEPRHRPKDYVL